MTLSEKELGETWQRVVGTRKTKVLRRARVRAAGTMLAVAALAALLVTFWPRANEQLLAADGTPWRQVAEGQQLHLADDSRIATSADGALEVLENGAARLSLHLTRGSAHFEVTPGTGRQWRVESGGVSVEVVGTIFDVTRRDASVEVTVSRGVVVVRGPTVPDGVRRLVAGERLVTGPLPAAAGLVGPTLAIAEPVAPPNPPVPVAPPAPRVAPVAAQPQPSRPSPLQAEPVAPPDSAAQRLAAADQARRDGRERDAIADLELVVSRWPDTPEGPLAAFTLANILDARGEVDAAHTWYARALELKLNEPLAGAARRALEGRPK